MDARQYYVERVLKLYQQDKAKVLSTYEEIYYWKFEEAPQVGVTERDIVSSCAELDADDGDMDAACFQDLWNDAMADALMATLGNEADKQRELAVIGSYLWMGASRHEEAMKKAAAFVDGGQIEMVSEIMAYAPQVFGMLKKLLKSPYGLPGVYHYEVVEAFGEWVARMAIEYGELPPRHAAEEELRGLVRQFLQH